MPKYPFSGVIIADQRSLHTNGTAPARGDGAPGFPAAAIVEKFEALFEEVILVAADPAAMLDRDGLIVSDHHAPAGLLSGIHAGLFAARHFQVIVTACTLPEVPAVLIDLLLGASGPRYDAVLPDSQDGLQPLPAVYAKSALKTLSRQLAHSRPSVRAWLRHLRVQTLAGSALKACEPLWEPCFRIAAGEAAQ